MFPRVHQTCAGVKSFHELYYYTLDTINFYTNLYKTTVYRAIDVTHQME